MTFLLRLQDPESDAATLLELLLECTTGADHGGAIFAFASTKGVQLLVDDPHFKAFLQHSRFQLIVGVDAVTVPATLDLLRKTEDAYDGFEARVFLHQRHGRLFHPKLSWFSTENSLRVLVGSGNLTRGGLLKNWEAFADSRLQGIDRDNVLRTWNAWRDLNDPLLRRVGDPEVLERAKRNEHDHPDRDKEDEIEETRHVIDAGDTRATVLLAEIPKAAGRWNQANFDLKTFGEFFQLQPGTRQRVVLLPIEPDGSVGEPEIRPSVSVKSRNFRIELGQARQLEYPESNRPLGIFLRVDKRRFRYRLVMPNQKEYPALMAFVKNSWQGDKNRIRRVTVPLHEFTEALPNHKLFTDSNLT